MYLSIVRLEVTHATPESAAKGILFTATISLVKPQNRQRGGSPTEPRGHLRGVSRAQFRSLENAVKEFVCAWMAGAMAQSATLRTDTEEGLR